MIELLSWPLLPGVPTPSDAAAVTAHVHSIVDEDTRLHGQVHACGQEWLAGEYSLLIPDNYHWQMFVVDAVAGKTIMVCWIWLSHTEIFVQGQLVMGFAKSMFYSWTLVHQL
jgi:hypothetical protein